MLIALFAGVGAGLALGPDAGWVAADTARVLTNWMALPGFLFLALIQMIVIPLVVSSIVLGMASAGGGETLRRTGLRAGAFFVLTTLMAVLIGLAAALLIRPGAFVDSSLLAAATEGAAGAVEAPAVPGFADLPGRIVELVPSNPLQAGLERNMMQVVLLALVLGVALTVLAAETARPLLELLRALQAVSMVVVRWAMYLVPLAVFGLIAQITTRLGLDALTGVGVYVLTVIAGLLVVMLMYLAIYAARSGRSPLHFLRESREVILLAFSTSSSAAVMPVTLRIAERGLGVSPALAQFVIPLGTTVNMAGTALYQVVATLFLAQVYGVDVGLTSLLLVVVLAVGASIGSPGTPGIGIVILAMLLGSIGIPAAGVALIIGVDRILDMCRTAVNVSGDLVACVALQGRTRATGDSAPPA